jgi:signal transduction histidine kinase
MEALRKNKDPIFRRKVGIMIIGIILFLLTFSWGNIVGTLSDGTDWRLPQWGLFGMPVFIGLLAYLIVRFKAFNIKAFATQVLVWALWIMIGAILFVAKTDATRIITSVTELLAIVFGIMLIKTVRKEVLQREQLQKLTNELASKNQKLQELDAVKSQFLSFASHDLKSPMNIIKQFSSLILDKTYATPEKVMETVSKIKLNAERGIRLVEDFLDFRKIEEGKMEYNFEKKNLVEVVRGLTDDFAVMAKAQKNIAVNFTSKQQAIPVMLDLTRFNQVIQNLLSNSLKYTEQGSISVSINEEQNTALISVSDTGLGINPEILPTLFEQFHRAPGVAKKINGAGLGLYISKQIVLGHGGEIWASSEGEGKGSTFFVRVKKSV